MVDDLETSPISQLLTPLVDKFGKVLRTLNAAPREAASIVRYGSGLCRRGAPELLSLGGVVQLTGEVYVDSGSRGTSPFSSVPFTHHYASTPGGLHARRLQQALLGGVISCLGSGAGAHEPERCVQQMPLARCTRSTPRLPQRRRFWRRSLPAVLRLLQNHEQLRVAIATSAARRDAIHADAVSACPVSATLKGGTSPIGRPSSIRPATPHRTPSRPASAPMLSATAQAEPLASLPVSPSWHRAKGAARRAWRCSIQLSQE